MGWIVANQKGQSLMEYALILFLAAISAIAGLSTFGGELIDLYNRIMSSLPWG